MRIYVASSWRNLLQPAIVSMLRSCGPASAIGCSSASRYCWGVQFCQSGWISLGINSEAEATQLGWHDIEPDPDGEAWTHLGICPTCWAADQSNVSDE